MKAFNSVINIYYLYIHRTLFLRCTFRPTIRPILGSEERFDLNINKPPSIHFIFIRVLQSECFPACLDFRMERKWYE